MKHGKLLFFASLFVCNPLFARTFVVKANDVTMHAGDALVPPCTFSIASYSGAYASLFKNQPTCTTSATKSSAAGTYKYTIHAGTGASAMSTVSAADDLKFVDGTLTVIAPDATGAHLAAASPAPPGFFKGPAFAAINVKANPICNLHGDGVTDDTACMQALLAWGRDSRKQKVTVQGTAVVASGPSTLAFSGLSGAVQIQGVPCVIRSVTDATSLVLESPCLGPSEVSGALLRPGGNRVKVTDGNMVTAVSGPEFTHLTAKTPLTIGGVSTQVASVTDATHLVTTTRIADATSTDLYAGSAATGWGRQILQLYFPASKGCYLMSNTLQVYGNYWTWTGDGPHSSTLCLKANTPAFNQGAKKLWINVPSISGNENFREFIYNMGFKVGAGNPDAEAIHWVANNMGAIENVEISNDDSRALSGIGLEGAYPGPTEFRNVAIYGFQYGMNAVGQTEYNVTSEGITLAGQSIAGIATGSLKLSIRHLLSDNSVPAYQSTGTGANTAILDSEIFSHGDAVVTGMTNHARSGLYGRDVKCSGYKPCEVDSGSGTAVTREQLPAEFWTGEAQSLFDKAEVAASLKLPVKEAPVPMRSTVQTELGHDPSTWADAILHSANSSIFLAPGGYSANASPELIIPNSVDSINFNNAEFNQAASRYQLNISVEGNSPRPLIIDGCLYTECFVSHTGTRTLVMRDSAFHYQAKAGAGNLFIENGDLNSYANGTNAGDGPTFYASQSVWARSLDIETGDVHDLLYPKLICSGCKLWILGYKTEQDSASLVLNQRAVAEVFGFFFYNLHLANPPANTGPIVINDSSLFAASGFLFVNGPPYGSPCLVVETSNAQTGCLPSSDNGTSQSLNMYHSSGANGAKKAADGKQN